MNLNLIGIVLAGGRSQRMGRDKSSLLYQGKSFLEQTRQNLVKTGADPVLISGPQTMQDAIGDCEGVCGPLGGLYSVARKIYDLTGPVLILPVDMPDIALDELSRLVSGLKDRAQAVSFERSPLPLALSDFALLKTINPYGDDLSLKAWLGTLNHHALRPTQPLKNYNHPHDLPNPNLDDFFSD